MKKAKSEERYLPWEYVFADSRITGRTTLRRGYLLAKETMAEFQDIDLDTL